MPTMQSFSQTRAMPPLEPNQFLGTGLSSLALSEVGLIASSVNVTVSRVWSSHGKASTIKMKLADADGQS
jgi:hypothetical protein